MSQVMIEAMIIMGVGVLGALLPLVPGPPIVWLGALYYGWRTDWIDVGWPSLTLLALLAIIGGTADVWMGYLGASKGGASIWATVASMIGGIVGFFILSVPGALIGSVGAIVAVEYMRHRDWRKVMRASGGYLIGSLLATVVEIIICVVMIGVFFAAATV
jgi:uncharacterized protein YqgC (DUF456 family)